MRYDAGHDDDYLVSSYMNKIINVEKLSTDPKAMIKDAVKHIIQFLFRSSFSCIEIKKRKCGKLCKKLVLKSFGRYIV